MSESNPMQPGRIGWQDLTVRDAETLRDFYAAVVGWTAKPESMGEYDDYSMIPAAGGAPAAGICHARGVNADVPPQWLIYIVVDDVDGSARRCVDLGGEIVAGPRMMGGGRFCVIHDPAGAVCALYSPPKETKE